MNEDDLQKLRSQVMGIGANISAVIEQNKQTERENRFLRARVVELETNAIGMGLQSDPSPPTPSSRSPTSVSQLPLSPLNAPPASTLPPPPTEQGNPIDAQQQEQSPLPAGDQQTTVSPPSPQPQRYNIGTQMDEADDDIEMTNAGTTTTEQISTNINTATATLNATEPPQPSAGNTSQGLASYSTLDDNLSDLTTGPAAAGRTTGNPLHRSTSASEIALGIRRRFQFSRNNQRALRLSRLPLSQNGPPNGPGGFDLQNIRNGGSEFDAHQVLADLNVYPSLVQGSRRGVGLQSRRPNNLSMKHVFRRFPTQPSDGGYGLGFFLGSSVANPMKFEFTQ